MVISFLPVIGLTYFEHAVKGASTIFSLSKKTAERQDVDMRITDSEFNRLKVFQALRRCEPVARTDLTEMTGLSSGTITELTGELIARGLVREERQKGRSPGRPRMGLSINPDAGYAVGVYTLMASLAVEIVDLKGEPVFAQQTPLPVLRTAEALAAHIAEVTDRAIRNSDVPSERIRRVGVALSGLVDSQRGVVHWIHSLPMGPVAVAELIEQSLKIPVSIDNEANVSARAEHWFGSRLDNFSLITVGLGLGFARYVDGTLATGANGLNLEFSHVKAVGEGGLPCYCGARGCLAAHCTLWGLGRAIFAQRGLPEPSIFDIDAVFNDLAEEADGGDMSVRSAIESAGRVLGTAISNHINASDPGAVLIRFLNARLAKAFSVPLRSAVEQNTLPTLLPRTQVTIEIGQDQYAKGTAALVLEQIYSRAS
jgi:predicted NBD/HSP70 family sugar kinase